MLANPIQCPLRHRWLTTRPGSWGLGSARATSFFVSLGGKAERSRRELRGGAAVLVIDSKLATLRVRRGGWRLLIPIVVFSVTLGHPCKMSSMARRHRTFPLNCHHMWTRRFRGKFLVQHEQSRFAGAWRGGAWTSDYYRWTLGRIFRLHLAGKLISKFTSSELLFDMQLLGCPILWFTILVSPQSLIP